MTLLDQKTDSLFKSMWELNNRMGKGIMDGTVSAFNSFRRNFYHTTTEKNKAKKIAEELKRKAEMKDYFILRDAYEKTISNVTGDKKQSPNLPDNNKLNTTPFFVVGALALIIMIFQSVLKG